MSLSFSSQVSKQMTHSLLTPMLVLLSRTLIIVEEDVCWLVASRNLSMNLEALVLVDRRSGDP